MGTYTVHSNRTEVGPFHTHGRTLRKDQDSQLNPTTVILANLTQGCGNYCKGCEECQKASPGRKHRAPLIPMPIMEEPFYCIVMDIVGPLPRSCRGHHYILVVCDYVTRYPEALPLFSTDAEHAAEELVRLLA